MHPARLLYLTESSQQSQAQQEAHVREVIQLEQWLMEGAYNKVLAARQDMPAPQFAHFIDLLATTVRCVTGMLAWQHHVTGAGSPILCRPPC